MSEWYEASDTDIDMDTRNRDFSIYVHSNDFGNVYVTLTFEQVKKMASEITQD